MSKQLSEFPSRIAALSLTVNELDQQLAIVKRSLFHMEMWADSEVAFDLTLKNENQRNVKRYQMLSETDEYGLMQEQLLEIGKQRGAALAELERERNAFSAAKLEMKQAIAQQLIGSEYRELVGV